MTDDQIKAECEKRFQNGGPRVFYFYPYRAEFFGSAESGSFAAICADSLAQVWARRKVHGANAWAWRRLTTAMEKRAAGMPPSDTAMLEWLCQDGRYVSHSRDGEYCNVWCDNPIEESAQRSVPVEGYPQKSYRTAREAIAAAMKVQP